MPIPIIIFIIVVTPILIYAVMLGREIDIMETGTDPFLTFKKLLIIFNRKANCILFEDRDYYPGSLEL